MTDLYVLGRPLRPSCLAADRNAAGLKLQPAELSTGLGRRTRRWQHLQSHRISILTAAAAKERAQRTWHLDTVIHQFAREQIVEQHSAVLTASGQIASSAMHVKGHALVRVCDAMHRVQDLTRLTNVPELDPGVAACGCEQEPAVGREAHLRDALAVVITQRQQLLALVLCVNRRRAAVGSCCIQPGKEYQCIEALTKSEQSYLEWSGLKWMVLMMPRWPRRDLRVLLSGRDAKSRLGCVMSKNRMMRSKPTKILSPVELNATELAAESSSKWSYARYVALNCALQSQRAIQSPIKRRKRRRTWPL